jgi:plastocyanin
MRRAGLTSVLAILALAWPGASALAVDHAVLAREVGDNDFYAPKNVTIHVGDTVKWHNERGKHNVWADNGSFKVGGDPVTHSATDTRWDAKFTFKSPGTFQYYCTEHGDKGGVGMSGKVIVINPNEHTPPKISSLAAKPTKFCTNKSQTCNKPGTNVTFTLSEDATVKADVKADKKGASAVQAFKKQLRKGPNSVSFSGKDLKPGNYVLTLRATDAKGNKSKPATIKLTVKKKG